jgi:hypothetical protein
LTAQYRSQFYRQALDVSVLEVAAAAGGQGGRDLHAESDFDAIALEIATS